MAERISREEALQTEEKPSQQSGGLPPEEDLEILGPDPETLEFTVFRKVDGRLETEKVRLAVAPMNMMQIQRFLKPAKKFIPTLEKQISGGGVVNLEALVDLAGDDFNAALAIALDCEPDVLGKLQPNDWIHVATKVLVVNMDFFVLTLPKALGRSELSVMNAVVRVMRGLAGRSQSSASSPQGTV